MEKFKNALIIVLLLLFIAAGVFGYFKIKQWGGIDKVSKLDSLMLANNKLNAQNDTMFLQTKRALFLKDSALNIVKLNKDTINTLRKNEKIIVDSIGRMYASQLEVELSNFFKQFTAGQQKRIKSAKVDASNQQRHTVLPVKK